MIGAIHHFDFTLKAPPRHILTELIEIADIEFVSFKACIKDLLLKIDL